MCILVLFLHKFRVAFRVGALAVGFIAAFVSGCLACQWMVNLVKKGKLIWFAIYCAVVGIATIIFSF